MSNRSTSVKKVSKINIPLCEFDNTECNTLFKSITDKLNIQNPKFYYPIYNRIIGDDTPQSALQNTIFNSKFKCKEILSKILDCDSDEYVTDNECDDDTPTETTIDTSKDTTINTATNTSSTITTTTTHDIINDDNTGFIFKDEKQSQRKLTAKTTNTSKCGTCKNTCECECVDIFVSDLTGGSGGSGSGDRYNNDNTNTDSITSDNIDIINDIFNTATNFDETVLKENNETDNPDENDNQIDEAVNNTFMANALIERLNPQTGEKIIKEEIIHIKKTALLEPIKIMRDEYIIPSRIRNKKLNSNVINRTNDKINDTNNCGYVESIFLYLGNKLVETGKCPTFPYYYGCVIGDDPNFHHNITDEYDDLSRNKWFRNRIETDFDLLIVQGNDDDDVNKNYYNSNNNSETNKSVSSCSSNNTFDKNISQKSDKSNLDLDIINTNINTNITIHDKINFIKELNDNDFLCDMDDIDDIQTGGNENIETDINTDNTDNIDNIDNTDNTDNTDIKEDNNKCDDEDNENEANEANEENPDKETPENTDEESEEENPENTDEENEDDAEDDELFIEELSDVEPDKLSFSDFNNKNNLYFIKCADMPVSVCLMEKLDYTLDTLLDDGYDMTESEWFAILFQIAFGLSIAQKYFMFVHNDLHSSNIMFKETQLKYLYFQINDVYYKIPTYGRITKIIDFARGTFLLGSKWIFSDQFKDDGDACGQYDYPEDGTLDNCENKPNPSFDLVRLGTSIIHKLDNSPQVKAFIETITKDDYNNLVCYDDDTFQMYIDIAHNCHNAIPLEVLNMSVFKTFTIAKTKIPKNVYVYKY